MKKELQDKLFDKYSSMFGDRTKPMSETCMCWGISCGDGWYALLDHMCMNLKRIQEEYDITVVFDQVKEKFGTLRAYHHIELGPRWTTLNNVSLLDDKPDTEYVSMGWRGSNKPVPVYECVSRQVDECVHVAEQMSEIICEDCGMSGAIQNERGWISTQCVGCRDKQSKEREEYLKKLAETKKV